MKRTRRIGTPGGQKQPATIIIARGEDIRYFTMRPWLVGLAGSLLAALTVGYFSATAYLVLRDDLLGATAARQAHLQQAYEDRISALRAQVDRITSRQLLDQQLMQRKVGELIERQDQLSERHGRLSSVLERAESMTGSKAVPLPTPRPTTRAEIQPDGLRLDDTVTGTAYAELPRTASSIVPWPLRIAGGQTKEDQLFVTINRSLLDIESEQIERVETLSERAYQAADTIADALASAGLSTSSESGNVGGPLITDEAEMQFEEQVRELDEALNRLEGLKQVARRVPLASPLAKVAVTSSFGIRRDPILGRPAHHSGVDFRAERGAEVRATGSGTVVKAGWSGGYGRVVEIDHGGGISTRYAHLSKILVKVGEKVGTGAVIGRAGSSGRSTGPHLHYEVRRDGAAVNPLKFIAAGRRIADYL